MPKEEEKCCPDFDPKTWNNKKIVWRKKLFVKDRVFSFFHIPLNFGMVMSKNIKKIKAAGAYDPKMMTISDEKSMFYSNVYLSVKKIVPGTKDVRLSGTLLTRVFEGPYKNMKEWIKEMEGYVKRQKKEIKNLYFYYTTCPECAKKRGRNYVVLLAEV